MNWVQRKIEKEKSINAGTEVLWQQLVAAIQDATGSYNASHYAIDDGAVQIDRRDMALTLKRTNSHRSETSNHPRETDEVLQVKIDGDTISAACESRLRRLLTVDVRIDGEYKTLFLSRNDKEVSMDEASRILTEGFLFGHEFSKDAHWLLRPVMDVTSVKTQQRRNRGHEQIDARE